MLIQVVPHHSEAAHNMLLHDTDTEDVQQQVTLQLIVCQIRGLDETLESVHGAALKWIYTTPSTWSPLKQCLGCHSDTAWGGGVKCDAEEH